MLEFALIFVLCWTTIITFFLSKTAQKDKSKIIFYVITILLLFVIYSLSISGLERTKKIESDIKPIDVYRGKTTLQITYQDSIPIDSVVVFK